MISACGWITNEWPLMWFSWTIPTARDFYQPTRAFSLHSYCSRPTIRYTIWDRSGLMWSSLEWILGEPQIIRDFVRNRRRARPYLLSFNRFDRSSSPFPSITNLSSLFKPILIQKIEIPSRQVCKHFLLVIDIWLKKWKEMPLGVNRLEQKVNDWESRVMS